MKPADYVTLDEFNAAAGTAYAVTDDEALIVKAVQSEVIDRLESWAHSAWPNIVAEDDVPEGAIMGYATEPREFSQRVYGSRSDVLLSRVPVIEIDTVTHEAVSLTGYELDLPVGLILPPSPLPASLAPVIVTYRYGFTETPEAIKAPVIRALVSRVAQRLSQSDSRIPANTRQLTTETATFVFDGERLDARPWPWDPDATNDVRAYWDSSRPRKIGAI
jgi:hypothetical protein